MVEVQYDRFEFFNDGLLVSEPTISMFESRCGLNKFLHGDVYFETICEFMRLVLVQLFRGSCFCQVYFNLMF